MKVDIMLRGLQVIIIICYPLEIGWLHDNHDNRARETIGSIVNR